MALTINLDMALFGAEHPVMLAFFVAMFGMMIGSFLNVLIYRLPLIMRHEDEEAVFSYLLGNGYLSDRDDFRFTSSSLPKTLWGRSYCPSCGHPVPWWLNIPVFGYLAIFGKSKCCSNKISARYPIIEALGGLVTLLAVHHFGWTLHAAFIVFAAFVSIALFMIDWDTFILPDVLVYPLLWGGLLCAAYVGNISLKDGVLGVIAGFCLLYASAYVFSLLRGTLGMGGGDFKLLAACGAWVGAVDILWVLVYAAVATLVLAWLGALNRDQDLGSEEQSGVPFGPGLLIGLWGVILF